uniref:GON domain-containing protein n=1 Tax=Panagrellus redivivus TaxID=6233 RepID=A0A7E4USE6_PANRE
MIVEHVNSYRAKINNNCAFLHGPVPPASNYRKVKYSCALEKNAKFECSSNMTFESDKFTWRKSQLNVKPRLFINFCSQSKWFNTMSIDPKTQTVKSSDEDAVFMKLFMSEDVTEVGCYVKLCDGIEYIACRSNHNSELPDSSPLYTPGQRCNVDSDCTLPGYHVCDATVGLCDYKSHHARKMEAYNTRCHYLRNIASERGAEKCNGNDTGSEFSNKEREATVFFVNSFRKLINNDCEFGKGVVKHISNYRKVMYSCAFEAESEFDCLYAAPETFKSDKYTLRAVGPVRNTSSVWSNFLYFSDWDHKRWLIDPYNQISSATESTKSFLRLTISPDVTEIGCYFKICGNHEYLACKTGHVVASLTNDPLYTPGKRCERDSDCTLPGYGICDVDYGLCEADWTLLSTQK